MNGFLNINKPTGMSSAAVVAVMKRLTGEKRIGHAGTLDPEAAGVLPVMVGKATRLFDYLVDKEKEYVAVAAFGASTDTQDATGRVLETGDRYPDRDTLACAAARLTGEIVQRPSAFSAIKVQGKPLYLKARRGEVTEAPARTVHIDAIEILREVPDHGWELRVRCGRGTYIRTLCHDLGLLCGCPAHMRSLVRTRSGIFTLENGMTLEEARARAAEGRLGENLLPPDTALGHLPRTDVSEALSRQVKNGARLPLKGCGKTGPADGEITRVYLEDAFWGLAQRQGDFLLWKALIAPEEEEPGAAARGAEAGRHTKDQTALTEEAEA